MVLLYQFARTWTFVEDLTYNVRCFSSRICQFPHDKLEMLLFYNVDILVYMKNTIAIGLLVYLYPNLYFTMQLNYNGKKVSLPFNSAVLKWASGTRQLLDQAKLPEGVRFYNIYGTSLDTPFDVW